MLQQFQLLLYCIAPAFRERSELSHDVANRFLLGGRQLFEPLVSIQKLLSIGNTEMFQSSQAIFQALSLIRRQSRQNSATIIRRQMT